MRRLPSALLLSLGLALPGTAQDAAQPSLDPAWTGQFSWQCIGPANMSGRITDLAVHEQDPAIVYVATASGGLLKSSNGGITYEHQFEHETTASIGAVAVSSTDPDLVWVGTGEENPRNSVSYGDGVYKSTDGGASWTNMGLRESFQIGSILIHRDDPDVVFVAALGRLYGPNEQRGLYKTTDGGESWQKVLHVDVHTGVIEIEAHPADPDTMLVASYERERDGFDTNDPAKKIGAGSGLWRTVDGGATFERITAGLPSCELGRIGLDWHVADPDIVYALVESAKMGMAGADVGVPGFETEDAEVGARVSEVAEDGPAAAAGLKQQDVVLAVDGATVLNEEQLAAALAQHAPQETVELMVARDDESRTLALTLGERGEDARNARPFGTRLGGQRADIQHLQGRNGHEHGGLFRSDDAGQTWRRVNSIDPRPMYFSKVRVDPQDARHVYVLGIRAAQSHDGGESFTGDFSRGVHADQHALWIDPRDGRHMLLGCDGGIYETRDRGASWQHHNHVAIGQFYHVAVGPRRDYWVYGGLQDNGTWGAPRRATRDGGTGNEDWIRVGGGDGFVVQVDAEDPHQIYYESQNGGTRRTHLRTMAGGRIRPRAPDGVDYRFNWKTPFALSHHNSRIYYTAGNHVFRSLHKGDDLKAISPEITLTDRGSATAFSESPRDAEVLYVGTDDGALWGTRDGGGEWTDLLAWEPDAAQIGEATSQGDAAPAAPGGAAPVAAGDDAARPLHELIPGPRWVSSLEASRFADGRVYVTLDAHRSDDDAPYVLVSEDHGATWRSLRADLPRGSTRVVREDRVNEDLLYLGTEFGFYVSIDRGATWTRFHGDTLPTVAIHEVAQHAHSGEIVLGTHGRSLWVCDVTALRHMPADLAERDALLLEPADVVRWRTQHRRGSSGGASRFRGENPRADAAFHYWLGDDAARAEITVFDAQGRPFRKLEAPASAGLHRVDWNLRGDPREPDPERVAEMVRRYGERARRWTRRRAPNADPGVYRVRLDIDGRSLETSLELLADPAFPAVDRLAELGRAYEAWLEEQERREKYGERSDASQR